MDAMMRAPMITLMIMPASAPVDRVVGVLVLVLVVAAVVGEGEVDGVCDGDGDIDALALPTEEVVDSPFVVLAEEAAEVTEVTDVVRAFKGVRFIRSERIERSSGARVVLELVAAKVVDATDTAVELESDKAFAFSRMSPVSNISSVEVLK
jgi:hypothetical protein